MRPLNRFSLIMACIIGAIAVACMFVGCSSLRDEIRHLRVKPTLTSSDSVVCISVALVDSAGATRFTLEPECWPWSAIDTVLTKVLPRVGAPSGTPDGERDRWTAPCSRLPGSGSVPRST